MVAAVEVVDAISKGKLTTEYSYHHGYWDGGEREFRGFGRVVQRDTEVFERYGGEGLHPGVETNAVPYRDVLAADRDAVVVPPRAGGAGARRVAGARPCGGVLVG